MFFFFYPYKNVNSTYSIDTCILHFRINIPKDQPTLYNIVINDHTDVFQIQVCAFAALLHYQRETDI